MTALTSSDRSKGVGGSGTGVLVVDMQNETLDPEGRLAIDYPMEAEPLIAAVRRLVGWAHQRGLPVVWLRLAFRPGHADAALNSMSRQLGTFVDGEWGAEILDGLGKAENDVVVTKRRPSGFFDTDLNIVLHGRGISRLLVAGISTHWAVESTVRDGHSRDYEMFVVREAVGSPFPEFHEPSLRAMASVFATVVGLEEVVGS